MFTVHIFFTMYTYNIFYNVIFTNFNFYFIVFSLVISLV